MAGILTPGCRTLESEASSQRTLKSRPTPSRSRGQYTSHLRYQLSNHFGSTQLEEADQYVYLCLCLCMGSYLQLQRQIRSQHLSSQRRCLVSKPRSAAPAQRSGVRRKMSPAGAVLMMTYQRYSHLCFPAMGPPSECQTGVCCCAIFTQPMCERH